MERPFSADFLYRLFSIASLFALFLPFFGPILDHHMAERHPYHAHVYFSSATDHVHFYENNHSHSHHQEDSDPGARTLPKNGPGNAEVVYLTSNDGLGQSVTSLAATTLHVDVVYSDPDAHRFLLRFGREDGLPPEAVVPPPRKPPRT
ncbi:MAG TPA: hypothetical protein VFA32_16780 [Dehalococcoidia bacterium]|nr:hypothetical protein [Dehalococcoidia bacterium]